MRPVIMFVAAAAFGLGVAATAYAADQPGKAEEGAVYYEPPQNLCEELGGSPECPPGGGPVDPAKAREMEEMKGEPEKVYQSAPQAEPPADASKPEAYQQLESDCEKAGWGGAPTCD